MSTQEQWVSSCYDKWHVLRHNHATDDATVPFVPYGTQIMAK